MIFTTRPLFRARLGRRFSIEAHMANDPKIPSKPEFLNSWKEIANYMGRGVRTVQRYEAQFRLPVRRPAGRSRSSVMATRAEIDAWVAASPIREAYQLTKGGETSRTAADMAAVKEGLKEMQKLREHMLELRSETRLALNVFMTSLNNLQVMLNSAQSAPLNEFALPVSRVGGEMSGPKTSQSLVSVKFHGKAAHKHTHLS